MNRKQRRSSYKKQSRQKYSLIDVQKAMNIAIEMKKHTKGHLFSKTLKNKCVFCGVTPKTKKQCAFWFFTFMDRVQTVLINPDFFRDDEVQALWLQHDSEYADIKIPMNIKNGKKT